MLTKEGTNSQGQTHWKLHVPNEHCMPGLEVGIFSTGDGLLIGGNLILWADLEVAKLQARGCIFQPPNACSPADLTNNTDRLSTAPSESALYGRSKPVDE